MLGRAEVGRTPVEWKRGEAVGATVYALLLLEW